MLDMKSKAACFTGHRTLPEENLPEIAERLENALIALIEQDYCYFSAGGRWGLTHWRRRPSSGYGNATRRSG